MDLTQVRLAIATPCYGGVVYNDHINSVMRAERHLSRLGVRVNRLTLPSESLIPRARNRLVHSFLCTDATHLMWIDADVEFDPPAIEHLLLIDKDVAGCAYPMKTIRYDEIVAAVKRNEPQPERFASQLVINPVLDTQTQTLDEGCMRVRDLATGFMLIKREVFFKMMEHYPERMYIADTLPEWGVPNYDLFPVGIRHEPMIVGGPKVPRYLSEDYYFCRLWQDMGNEIYLDCTSNLNHIGTHKFRGDVRSAFTFRNKDEIDFSAGATKVD